MATIWQRLNIVGLSQECKCPKCKEIIMWVNNIGSGAKLLHCPLCDLLYIMNGILFGFVEPIRFLFKGHFNTITVKYDGMIQDLSFIYKIGWTIMYHTKMQHQQYLDDKISKTKIPEKVVDSPGYPTCGICKKNKLSVVYDCGHLFCYTCTIGIMKNGGVNCPVCSVTTENVVNIT
jgi:hypothetical protein